MRKLISNIFAIIFYVAIIVCPIYDAFDKCNTPWNWIISIFYILGWAAWFLFILMVVPASRNAFPPTFNETNNNNNSNPKQISSNSESINKTNT